MHDLFDLTGKTAVITGAARGLGREMSIGLHDAGAEIVIMDILDQGAETAKEIGSTGAAAFFFKVNLMDEADMDRAFKEVVEKVGKVDILINCAGLTVRNSASEYTMEQWHKVMSVNMDAVFHMSQLAGNHMIENGGGRIINIASVVGVVGSEKNVAYSSSKGAVIQMSKSLSNEWAGKGVNVNVIAPGYYLTAINKDAMPEERKKRLLDRIPKGFMGDPAYLRGVAVFLAAPASEYVTGVVLPVDGGFLSR